MVLGSILLPVGFMHAATPPKEPQICDNASFQGFSPNGNFITSELYGTVTIMDFENNKSYVLALDEDGASSYSVGLGNHISNNG